MIPYFPAGTPVSRPGLWKKSEGADMGGAHDGEVTPIEGGHTLGTQPFRQRHQARVGEPRAASLCLGGETPTTSAGRSTVTLMSPVYGPTAATKLRTGTGRNRRDDDRYDA